MKRFLILVNLIILCLLIISAPTHAADWYDTDWGYRVLLGCNNPISGAVMSDSPVVIYYDDDTQTGAGEVDCRGLCQSDFDDIIITEDDGTTILPRSEWSINEEVDSDHIALTLIGDGDKYVYFGNPTYTYNPTNANLQYSVAASLHGFIPGGFYSASENRLYLTFGDAGYSPWLSWYNTSTEEWGNDAFIISNLGLSDVHSAPGMYVTDNTIHESWGGHNTYLYYKRSLNKELVGTYDLTDFTEVDPTNALTVTASSVSGTVSRNISSYVYYDAGVNYFSGNIRDQFTMSWTGATLSPTICVYALSNSIGDYDSILADDGIFVHYYRPGGGNTVIYLTEQNGGYTQDLYTGGVQTSGTLYCTFYRDEGIGTYGTAYLYLYSDADRTTLIDTLSITLTEKQDYRYLYALNTYNDGNATSYATMTTSDYTFNNWSTETVISTKGTYPRFTEWDDNGTKRLRIWYRERQGDSYWAYKESTNDGATWGSSVIYIDGSTDPFNFPYQTDLAWDDNGNYYIIFEYMYLDGTTPYYDNVYVAVYDNETDDRWESLSGDALSTPITKAEADAYCKVVTDEDSPLFHWGRIALDSSGNPAIEYQDYDGTYNDLLFQRWNGSSWEASVEVASNLASTYILNEFSHISGAGATAVYNIYCNSGSSGYVDPALVYSTSNGGASWSSSVYSNDPVISTCPITFGTNGTSQILYTTIPADKKFPCNVKVYPEPADTIYNNSAGYLYTYKDIFNRVNPSVQLDAASLFYQLYAQVRTDAQETTIENEKLKFISRANGQLSKLWTVMDFDTSAWPGYHVQIGLPDYTSQNAYTLSTFGTCKENSWASGNLPNDGIYLAVDTSGTKCDVYVQIAGSSVITDIDNDVSGSDFDIYVLKDPGGDQITITNNSGANTIYSGTIPASGQLDDQVNIFMGTSASGGSNSIVYYDNLYFSTWDDPEPTWSVAGAIESLVSTVKNMMIFF